MIDSVLRRRYGLARNITCSMETAEERKKERKAGNRAFHHFKQSTAQEMFRAKKYKPRKSPKMELFRKRMTSDYSDFAYREAVSKLKYLLAESYTPIHVHKYTPGGSLYKTPFHSSYENLGGSDSYLNRHVKLPPSRAIMAPRRPDTSEGIPAEYASYMRQQDDYIGHLEKESQSCRDELSNMLEKVKDVIAENEKLRQAWKMTGSGIDSDDESEISEKETKKKCKHIVAPNIVFESRISELEAQLTQAKIELRKAQDESHYLKTQKIECTATHYPHDTNKQIEALQRERDELNETICNLQSLVSQLRDKEASATQKVKRSLDLVDQAHFDKNQVIDAMELEVRRLKSELERMNDKQRETIQDSARRVNEAERRYAMQIERLNSDLASQWDTANRLNLELDRSKRTEQELRRDLAQKISTIEELKKELMTKTSNLQTEALTAGAERENLESELANSKMAIERAERNGRQEIARLQAEVQSLRQRLERNDADLLHSRKENLRLTDDLGSLEKELELAKMSKEGPKDPKRNEELAAMIKEMDAKHAQSVTELEGMILSQTQLMEKLKNECQTLTERLEDSSARHKEEMAGLQSNIEYLNSKLEAPGNYENQEWRDDGMVNNYGEDQGQYEGAATSENPKDYEANADGGYTQNGEYQEQTNYDGEGYTQDGTYQEGAYPEGYQEQEYDPNYQDPNYQDPNYQDPNYQDPNYMADYTPEVAESQEAPQATPAETPQVYGVDATGGNIVAQQEEFIPQPNPTN